MGIGGGTQIVELLPRGLYNGQKLKVLNLYVDGEFIRFKGHFESNLTSRCPEEAIAQSSYSYLKKRILMLVNYFGKTFTNTYIFMDGKRVQNKIERVYHSGVNDYEIRTYFKRLCSENKYTVVQLEDGESELHMYLKRDRHSCLNVFLTRDSDMLSILYAHKPTIVQKQDTALECLNFNTFEHDKSTSEIEDQNDYYNSGDWLITDSCVWALCDMQKTILGVSSNVPFKMIGFDFAEELFGYNALVWRIYCILCGTDFTPPLFTSTTRKIVMQNMRNEELEFLNKITKNINDRPTTDQFSKDTIMKIIVTLLIVAKRCGSLKKRQTM